ncbi:hypothetical protein LCGC14_1628250 [marine sediment metagenome]|uniref:Uncharacterized protein n=1 Tax=marine sediment metagenome TaxID=412755 RepID=A0A0F9I3F1_9ZZZZ
MPLVSRQFRKGDVVKEAGTNLKGVITKVEKVVERIKVEMIEGEEKGYEAWYDVEEFVLFKKKELKHRR